MNNKIRHNVINSIFDLVCFGYEISEIKSYLKEYKVSKGETLVLIDSLISANYSRKDIMEELNNYAKSQKDIKIDNVKCYICKENTRTNELVDFSITDKKNKTKKVINKAVCKDCISKYHKGMCVACNTQYFVLSKLSCPLFKKCGFKGYCGNEACKEQHLRYHHRKYIKRDWKPVRKFIGGKKGDIITSSIPVGVELEVVGVDRKSTRREVFKLDKNIGISNETFPSSFEFGTEIQTPPASLKKLEILIKDITKGLKEGQMVVNNNCGTHVHIDVEKEYGKLNKNPVFYKSLLMAYSIFQGYFFQLLPTYRHNNKFCKSLPNYINQIRKNDKSSPYSSLESFEKNRFSKIWYNTNDEKTIKLRKKNNHRDFMRHSSDVSKHTWVNFHSLIRGNGLEIRSLEGTLSPNVILNWINLHQKFIIGVGSLKSPMYSKENVEKFSKLNDNQKYLVFLSIIEPACRDMEEFDKIVSWIDSRINQSRNSIMLNSRLSNNGTSDFRNFNLRNRRNNLAQDPDTGITLREAMREEGISETEREQAMRFIIDEARTVYSRENNDN